MRRRTVRWPSATPDGVGVGIAVDGKLLRGAHNIAGEYGHRRCMFGPVCSCGQRGCWKRARIQSSGRPLPGGGPVMVGTPTTGLADGRRRDRARTRGEARAIETLRETGYYLGQGFSTIVKSVDPVRIYIGGEITEAWDLRVDGEGGAA